MFNVQSVTKVVIFIGCIVAVYYFYRWLAGAGELKDGIVYSNTDTGLLAMSKNPTAFGDTVVPSLYAGGEFSISTWIYVTNWSINKGVNKTFLTLSGGGGTSQTMIMYLGQNVNKLGIRVSYDTPDYSGSGSKLDSTQMAKIMGGVTPYTDVAGDFKKCDIESVDLQRWVNITTVLSGRTLDVYIDGKLSRSCVLGGLFTVDGDKPTMVLGGPTGFGGYIGQTRAANYAYSPDQVYTNYLNGPTDMSWWTQLINSFPNYFAKCKMNPDVLSALPVTINVSSG